VAASFTDEQLVEFARQHIAYEVGTSANFTVSWYYSQLTASRQVQSALMFATLVHLRLLADFLYREPRKDDVAATHYLTDWNCDLDPLGVERVEIDGHVAHLTMRRQTRRMWDLVELASGVFHEMKRFLAELEQPTTSRFSNAFEDCRDLVWTFHIWLGDSDSVLEMSEPVDLDAAEPDWYRRLPALPMRARGS
jgi:hypothetical protein